VGWDQGLLGLDRGSGWVVGIRDHTHNSWAKSEHKAILTRLGGLKDNHIGRTMHDFFQRVTQECPSDRDDSSSESVSSVIGDQLTYC